MIRVSYILALSILGALANKAQSQNVPPKTLDLGTINLGFEHRYARGFNNGPSYSFGVNCFWLVPKKSRKIDHTIGIHLKGAAYGRHEQSSFYFAYTAGLDYHLWIPIPEKNRVLYVIHPTIRISPSFEEDQFGNTMIGGDIGLGFMGLIPFYSCYVPINKTKGFKGLKQRWGIKFVYNLADAEVYE